jgi:hypothetical protein
VCASSSHTSVRPFTSSYTRPPVVHTPYRPHLESTVRLSYIFDAFMMVQSLLRGDRSPFCGTVFTGWADIARTVVRRLNQRVEEMRRRRAAEVVDMEERAAAIKAQQDTKQFKTYRALVLLQSIDGKKAGTVEFIHALRKRVQDFSNALGAVETSGRRIRTEAVSSDRRSQW